MPEVERVRTRLPIPDPTFDGDLPFEARDPRAVFLPIQPLLPPEGAPNVLIVLVDDVGFAASSDFGGPCATPEPRPTATRRGTSRSPGTAASTTRAGRP